MAAQPTPFADPATHTLNQETLAYGRGLIADSRAVVHQGNTIPPAWTPFRSHLPEALDYVSPGAPSECISDGHVVACILDEFCGDRTYLDSEIVITQICRNVSRDFGMDPWFKGMDDIIAAYRTTRDNAASLVVIQTDGFKSKTLLQHKDTRYFVLDHFRVGLIWEERTETGGIHHYVRLEKCDLQTKSWWTPRQGDPPARREFLGQHGPLCSEPCSGCGDRSPHIYNEGILCLNQRCPQFFKVINSPFAPIPTQDNLTFSERFLMYRSYVDSAQLPPFPLVSDIFQRLNQLTGSALAHSKMLLHGIVCPRDHSIVPKLFWDRWSCSMCPPDADGNFNGNFNGNPQLIDLQAVVPRNFVSYKGHPPLSFQVPEAFYARKFPKQYQKHYMIDKWVLHDDCQLIVLSPTAEFNEQEQGPNNLFTQILRDANDGQLLLHRHKELGSAVIDDHFHSNWGAPYGFWGYQDNVPLAQGPMSVNAAHQLLDSVMRHETGAGDSNAVQIMGFMQDQGVQWHTDGEGELGERQAMVLLGGDAIFKIKLEKSYYNNEGAFDIDGEIVRGAKNWEKVLNIKTMAAIGHYPDDTELYEYSYGSAREKQPEIHIPMIHGSIVILQGRTFHKYYENSLEMKGGPLSFAIVAREILEDEHLNLLMGKYAHNSERPNGPLFSDPDLKDPGDVDVTPPRQPIPIVVQHVRPRAAGTRRGRTFPVVPGFADRRGRDSSEAPSQTGSAASDQSTIQARRDRLLHLKKTTNLSYEEMRQQEGWTDWNVNAMGSAYVRERDRRVRDGTYSPPRPGGVVNNTRVRRTPRPATVASNARGAWSQEELDEIWELRNRNPPVPFTQIEEMKGGARTAKAYREQMGVEKKRRAGLAVTGVTSGAARPTTQQRRTTLTRTRERAVTRGETPKGEDTDADADVPDVPPLPNQQWPGPGDRWEAEDEDDGQDEEDEAATSDPGPSRRG